MAYVSSAVSKGRIASFLWQHLLLFISLYLMTLGVVLCIKSYLGSSVISSLPLAFSIAGSGGVMPEWTVGGYTVLMNFVFVVLQVAVLRRRFEPVQLFQLVIGFVFGWLIDLNAGMLAGLECESLWSKAMVQLAGCTVMGIGIAFEVRCGSVTMPGEGITVALSRVFGTPFPKMKICVDTACPDRIRLQPAPLEEGTLFAMVYVGIVVKVTVARSKWFDSVVHYVPGFRRYVFGLARYIYQRRK